MLNTLFCAFHQVYNLMFRKTFFVTFLFSLSSNLFSPSIFWPKYGTVPVLTTEPNQRMAESDAEMAARLQAQENSRAVPASRRYRVSETTALLTQRSAAML